jgi:hypothetical protein
MKRKFDLFVIKELAIRRIMSKLEDAWGQNLQSYEGSFPINEWVRLFEGNKMVRTFVFPTS